MFSNKIELVKKVRDLTGLGLRESVRVVNLFEKEGHVTLIEEPRIEVHIQRVDHLTLPPKA